MTSPSPRGRMWSIDNIRPLLERLGGMRVRSNDEFSARCPVHDDKHASLSVSWKHDPDRGGMTLLNCHGCHASREEITAALGITLADLFDEPLPERLRDTARVGRSAQQRAAGKRRKPGRLPPLLVHKEPTPEIEHNWHEVCRYSYCDADGVVVQDVVREECSDCALQERHKRFRQMFVGAYGSYVKRKPNGFVPVLYRLPSLLEALAADTPVWLLEGEKDVDTAAGVGLVATTNTQGGLNFPPESAALFEGSDVRVVLDRDGAGWDRGVQLSVLLGDVGARVQLLVPATTAAKSDFTDHVEAGLWDGDAEWGGLVAVSADEVAAHSVAVGLRAKLLLVEQARAEAAARAELAIDAPKADAELKRAQAWAMEAERRFESMNDAVEAVRRHAGEAATDWAGEAVGQASETWRTARSAARAAHEIARLAVPPALQDDDQRDQPDPADPATIGSGDTTPPPGHRPFEAGSARRGMAISAPAYRVLDGQVVEMVTRDGIERAKLVLGIDARIVEMEYLERADTVDVDRPQLFGRDQIEGQAESNPPAPEQLSAVVIGYTHPDTDEFMRLRIDAADFRDCGWVESLPGPPEYDSRPAGIAKLRDALKVVAAGQIKRTIRYRSTGWRQDSDGGWFFVHAGGAIHRTGAKAAPVLLNGPLARYDLPAPTTDAEQIRESFLAHSGALMSRLPNRIGAPLLGQVYRSALGPCAWVLLLVGSPGSYKTSVASLGMHHWGELWDRRHPGSSMSGNGDTLNALRIKLNSAKDALYWADDVAPTRGWTGAQSALEEFARLVFNGEQRSRSTRDGQGVLEGTPPRASAIVTSEVMPRPGSSGGERSFPVPMLADDIELETLIALDRDESRYGRALLMSSFLRWLSERLPEMRSVAVDEAQRFAAQLRESGGAVRGSDAASVLWSGWVVMGRFLVDVDALSQDEVDNVLDYALVGLTDAITASADPDLPSRTGARVKELIAHALRSGIAYVDDVRSGEAPAWPLAARLGWRRTPVGEFESVKRYREDARGIRLGYVLSDPGPRDGSDAQLLVWQSALEQVLKETAQRMSDAPQIDLGTAVRALYDEGILIAEERGGTRSPRYTVQRTLHCENRRQRVTSLRLWKVIGENPDGDQGALDLDPDDVIPDPDGHEPTDLADLIGATCPDRQLQSESSTTEQEPTNPDPKERDSMGRHRDGAGVWEESTRISPELPCLMCDEPAGHRFGEQVVHLHCWTSSTAESRRAAAEERASSPTSTIAPAAEPVPSAPTAVVTPTRPEQGNSSPVAPRRRTVSASSAADTFTAPVAVAHVDGVWLPDGTKVPLPQLSHVGHVAELVESLNLGHRVNDRWSEPGQIWVTAALLETFGVDVSKLDEDDPKQRKIDLGNATAATPFVTDALADGWKLGGAGDRLGAWTRVWRGEQHSVWVVLAAGLSDDPHDVAVLGDQPSPARLARRLNLFTTALDTPFAITPQTTGFDLMISTRFKDRKHVFGTHEPCAPERISSCEDDISWSRKLMEHEQRMQFVHSYDRGGSHLAGMASLELPIGASTHYPDGAGFDKKLPGYWRVEVPESGDWRLPHPLLPIGGSRTGLLWMTTPSLVIAAELGYELDVVEAYVWHEHGRVLDPFYTRLRDARTSLDIDDVDAQLARDLLKSVYTRTIGQMGSATHMKKPDGTYRDGFSPVRRHHVIAKARANIMRLLTKIGQETDNYPVAVSNDTIVYVSDNPNPIAAWPLHDLEAADPKRRSTFGRGLGQYKWEGSALLADHSEFLTGGRYVGKEELSKDWNPEG